MTKQTTQKLLARHGDHHYANIKYGYALLFMSALYVVFRYAALSYYHKCWSRSGRSTTKQGLVNVPLAYTVSILSVVLLILEFFNLHIEEFSIHLKRFGRLAYALTPLDLFLALRPSPLSIDNYLDTLRLHKWVSRVILVFGICHSVGFLLRWLVLGTFSKTWRLLNFYGFVMFVLFDVLLGVNWQRIRSINYTYFIAFHNLVMYTYLILTQLHARPGVTLLFVLNVALVLYQHGYRLFTTKSVTVDKISEKSGSALQVVKLPRALLPAQFLPGCHLRITPYAVYNPCFWLLPSHPYTVASIQEERSQYVSLVVKKNRFALEPYRQYSLQPFFKSSLSLNFFQTAESVTIVSGGSGISLGLPLFNYFKRKIQHEKKDIKLLCVWLTPNVGDLFILEQLEAAGLEVYVTRSSHEEEAIEISEGLEAFELQSLDDDFQTYEESSQVTQSTEITDEFATVVKHGRRPSLEKIIAKNVNRTIDYANKWIVSCGPTQLNKDCQHLAEKLKCQFFGEEYAM
ncbi:hypothetical protein KL939_000417 [Ogataea angusta]|nr:hypothetical protein KL939_000417 [Ogataea angusta]